MSAKIAFLLSVAVLSPPAHATRISVLSWNLLSPQFATVSRYPWATAEELAWPRRQKCILQQLADADADVVCLQEVDIICWDGLHAAAARQGYDGVIQTRKDGHPFANAVLLRRSARLEIVRSESRSRALITVLKKKKRAGNEPPLYLANVHLESGVRGGQFASDTARFYQIRSLLRRVELQCGRDAAVDGAAFVLCGDFNMDASLYELLVNGRAPKWGDFSHPLLPLVDAYSSAPMRSTQRSGKVLDFIFASGAVAVLQTTPVGMTSYHMPSAEHPSDHLPIAATLSWAEGIG